MTDHVWPVWTLDAAGVLDQVEKALKPFAEQAGPSWPAGHPSNTDDALTHNAIATLGDFRRAAEALAALRQWREQAEQGPWRVGSKIQLNVYEGDRPVCQCHSEEDAKRIVAACNGQLAGIPKELRETLIEACREAEHELRAEAANYRSRGRITDDVRASGADATAERYADARKQLEAL